MLRSYADHVARLDAEEALLAITIGRVGSGAAKKSDAQRVVRRLRREAEKGVPVKPAAAGRLRAAGIGVEYRDRG